MTDTAKLKAAALAATPGPWRYQKQLQSRTRKSALKTTRGVVNLLAGDVTPANSEFIALANPAVVLELIALEAAEWRLAELENDEVRQRLANAEHQLYMAELAKNNFRASRKAQFKKRKAAEKRNAELEQALSAAENNEIDARCHVAELEKRVAELEARTVRLPDNCEHDVMAPVASFMYEDGYEFDGEDYSALVGRVRSELETVMRRSLRAAGINLEAGGE